MKIDEVAEISKFYIKHADKKSKTSEDIASAFEYHIFELICVVAWNCCSSSGERYKNDIRWGALATNYDNIVSNYPQKHWWRESLIKFLPSTNIPKGVTEIANKFRVTSAITSTWRKRHASKINGNTEQEILKMFFGNKVEDVAKKAIREVSMHYNKLYRTQEELPSGSNNWLESIIPCYQERFI